MRLRASPSAAHSRPHPKRQPNLGLWKFQTVITGEFSVDDDTAGLDRTLEGAAEAAVDWRELLRRFWSEATPADYSWMRPNRRHLWTGLYLPGVVREGVGEVAIAIDCSGSVSARQLRLFEAEVRSILEGQRPERSEERR